MAVLNLCQVWEVLKHCNYKFYAYIPEGYLNEVICSPERIPKKELAKVSKEQAMVDIGALPSQYLPKVELLEINLERISELLTWFKLTQYSSA